MNKVIIPAILVVTVIVAGIFAFIPIEKSATVHASIGTFSLFAQNFPADMDVGDTINLTCTAPAEINSIIVDLTGSFDNQADNIKILFDVDGDGNVWQEATLAADVFGTVTPADNEILNGNAISINAGGTVKVELDAENVDGTDESIRAMFGVRLAGGSCSTDITNVTP